FVSPVLKSILGYYPTEITPKTWVSVMVTAVLDLILIVVLTFVSILWNKAFRKKNIDSIGYFLLFPLGQAMFLLASIYRTALDLGGDLNDNPLLVAAMGVSAVSDVLMLVALIENDRVQNMKLRMEQLEKDMERQLQYYEALSEQFETIREYSHDIRNLVATAKALPLAENSRHDRELLIQGMEEKTDNLSVPIYCSSPLINAVLWQKSREAEKAGVALATDVRIESELNTDRVDICSLLVNLLDNAIEEAAQTCGEVHFSISQSAGIMFFETENPSVRVIEANTPRPKTRKTGDHGHGTVILTKIAEKYGGTYALSADGKTAHAVVSLRL
ncbi:MAG: sensor histidine kinase, partial [Oscillospiraceae bacterium]